MSRNIVILVITSSFLFIPSTGSADEPNYAAGEVLVRFAPKANGEYLRAEEADAIVASACGGIVKDVSRFMPGLMLVKTPDDLSVENAVSLFRNTPGVLHAQPNFIYRTASTFPDDPRGPTPNGGEQWGLHNIEQTGGTPDADIDAPQAWDIATDSNIIVAVIDSGVDYNHPDLGANMWHNPGEIPGNGIDDDGNGYIDDIYGYDFCTFGSRQRDSDPMDDSGHGTHCAGIIGAVGNNEEGVTGVCWNVKIMALKFMTDMDYGLTFDAVDSINYAVAMGAKVLNNSYGGDEYDQFLKDAIDAANAAGVLFVAAAGNDGSLYPHYPASYDCNNIISVMATDHNDNRSSFSNYGATSVDLGAPGSSILSCLLGSSYGSKSGTSMAAPHVAGACALVWSMNQTSSHLEVKDIILSTVDQLPALDGLCVTGGRLNLCNALANTSSLFLDKVDDINDGVIPGDYITYTISYGNPVTDPCDPNHIGDVNDVNIIDYLPDDVVFNSASGPNSVYDPIAHTVTWDIGTLEPNESGSVTLTVKVNECIPGYGVITNLCKIEGGDWTRWTRENTPVCSASNPEPACGEIVGLDVGEFNLSWCPGLFAADVNGHEVYFGSNFDDVNDANNSWPIGGVYKGEVNNPSYPIDFNSLDVDTTYYWRIDEVNANHPDKRWRGGVWTFTIDSYLVVDNFDSYKSRDALTDVWDDYWENDSRAFLQLVKTGEPGQRPVRDDNSMEYKFLNDEDPYYSVAEVDIVDINDPCDPNDIGPDWSIYEELVLWFYGQSDNPVNSQMYVSLTDGDSPSKTATVPYGMYDPKEDMNDIKEQKWQEWNIDLQEFLDDNDDVNLANVATITIGFGDGSSSDPGIVYFEDIRLYLRSCFPGYDPVGDFDLDCDVDLIDYAIFAAAWQTQAGDGAYNEDCDLEDNNSIDFNDLARFCDDWLWQVGRRMSMSSGFGEALYRAAPLEQAQLALEPEPQLQFQPLTKADIEELVDWLEELWLTDEELRKAMDEDEWQEFIEAVRDSE